MSLFFTISLLFSMLKISNTLRISLHPDFSISSHGYKKSQSLSNIYQCNRIRKSELSLFLKKSYQDFSNLVSSTPSVYRRLLKRGTVKDPHVLNAIPTSFYYRKDELCDRHRYLFACTKPIKATITSTSVLYSAKRNDNSWGYPSFSVGSAKELDSSSECLVSFTHDRNTEHISTSLLSLEDDLSPARIYYEKKAKRYCYFERSSSCVLSGQPECRIDSRPCASDRTYLDHIYGSHNFPTIAKLNTASTTSPGIGAGSTLRSHIDSNPAVPPSYKPIPTQSPSINPSNSSRQTKSKDDKNINKLVSSIIWLEDTAVGVAKAAVFVASLVVNFLKFRPTNHAREESVSHRSSDAPNL